jgi:hypothetical protein
MFQVFIFSGIIFLIKLYNRRVFHFSALSHQKSFSQNYWVTPSFFFPEASLIAGYANVGLLMLLPCFSLVITSFLIASCHQRVSMTVGTPGAVL